MKGIRILKDVLAGMNPFRAVVKEVVMNPPSALKGKNKVHPAVEQARKSIAELDLSPVAKPREVARPLKAPVVSGTVEGVGAGVAYSAAVVALYILNTYVLAEPLPGEVQGSVLGLLTMALAGVLKALRKRNENAKTIETANNELLKKTFPTKGDD